MFDDIRPYNDIETSEALRRSALNPAVDKINDFLFPEKDVSELRSLLSAIKGVDDFQERIMYPAVRSIIAKTTDGLSFDGIDNFEKGKCYLLLSTHRDIVLDSAFIQKVLKENKLPLSEIAVGDNLIYNEFVGDLMRSNRMVKVRRTRNPRELYEASEELSAYMRYRIHNAGNPSSIWIAHRNGRTKDGCDATEQGLLKMLSLSGNRDFVKNMEELSIMPVAISYEIEPCGIQKACEVYAKQTQGSYSKKPGEDFHSILTGIIQPKGRVHIGFCKPVIREELEQCALCAKNDRFRALAQIVDERLKEAFKIWPVNVAAAQMRRGEPISDSAAGELLNRILKDVESIPQELDRNGVREILIDIYANPAIRKGY